MQKKCRSEKRYRILKKTVFLLLVFLIALECRAESIKIVSLAPNTTEILFALGLGKSIVGVDLYSNYPEEARSIKRLGTFSRPNMEKLILLKPDYIVIGSDMNPDALHYLKSIGINIIKISPRTVNDLCEDIGMLGDLFHARAKAQYIVNDINVKIDRASRNMNKKRPMVFVQLFHDPLVTVSNFINDVIMLAGGESIASDIKNDSGLFSYELLLDRNPDVVIMAGFSDEDSLPSSINAVKRGKVFKDLNPDVLLRPGPRVADAIEELNRIFYE